LSRLTHFEQQSFDHSLAQLIVIFILCLSFKPLGFTRLSGKSFCKWKS